MKDNEKQIEEMAKIIKDNSIIDVTYGGKPYADDYENLARKLLEHYQPKIPENSVVIPKKEYEDLKGYKEDLMKLICNQWGYCITLGKLKCVTCGCSNAKVISKEEKDKTDKYITDLNSMIDNLKDDLKQSRKETAEKYNDKLVAIIQHLFDIGQIDFKAKIEFLNENEKILKQLGVEIKE